MKGRTSMPLPLGHTAIGLAVYEICKPPHSTPPSRWRRISYILLVMVLANLPDIDILGGLLSQGNGYAFHRGPTHSFLFALIMGYGIHQVLRRSNQLPQIGAGTGVFIISSHIMADYVFTDAPVSFFWPLEIYWCGGHEEWSGIMHEVLLKEYQDLDLLLGSLLAIIAVRWLRKTLRRSKYRLWINKGTQQAN
jgi:hypothetical protein